MTHTSAFLLNLLDKQQYTELKTHPIEAHFGLTIKHEEEENYSGGWKRGSTLHLYNIKYIYGSFGQLEANLKQMSYALCKK